MPGGDTQAGRARATGPTSEVAASSPTKAELAEDEAYGEEEEIGEGGGRLMHCKHKGAVAVILPDFFQ